MSEADLAQARSTRWTLIFFGGFILLLIVGTTAKMWMEVADWKGEKRIQQLNASKAKASTAFFFAAMHLLRPSMTREQIEARLPDPKPIKVINRTAPDGTILVVATYHDPKSGGRIRVSYSQGYWSGLVPSDVPPVIWNESLSMRTVHLMMARFKDYFPLAWGITFLLYLLAKRRTSMQASALGLLALALTYMVTSVDAGWRVYAGWRFRFDASVVWAIGLTVLSLLLARASLRELAITDSIHCPNCGYDLRATPDRCPECGTIVHMQASS